MKTKTMGGRGFASLRAALVTLCLLVSAAVMNAANPITVSGQVTSAGDGEPLAGVSVLVKGASQGVVTNFDGMYQIKAEEGATLVFSYIGFNSREAVVTSSQLSIALIESSAELNEVVVVGYGTLKKKLVTGATAQIKGDEIAKMNTTSPLQAMQGQLAGVNISSNSGQPGESMKVQIRGLGTIGNSGPLYLIDGIGGDISTLNPADIESIDVLKDAASAAIYGAQAANGVVLVTTKQGREGSAKVSFDGYFGWQSAPKKLNMLNAREYMTIMDEQQVAEGFAPYDWDNMSSIWRTNAEGERLGVYDTDWVDQMFKDNAITQSYTIGVTGGNAKSTYAMSLGYIDQEGIAGGKDVSNYSRYNFRINSDHKLFDGLITVGEQASFIYTTKKGIGVGNIWNNSLRSAMATSPIIPVYDQNGEFYAPGNSDWNNLDTNPYGALMTNNNNVNHNATFSGNVYAQVEPIKNLKIRTVFGAVYNSSDSRSYSPIYYWNAQNYSQHTSVSQYAGNGFGLTWTNTASYDFKVKEHAFNVLVGMESYRSSGISVGANQRDLKEGFDTWTYAYVNNGTAATTADGLGASGSPWDESRSVSYFGRLGWNWAEKYMINFTLRSDGSSKFAKGHRFGTFPSVSAGWNISNENFMEGTRTWLDYLKIRASWGRVGNQNISNYMFLAPIKVTNTHYFFGEYFGANGTYGDYSTTLATNWGAYPNRLGNADISWETSEQTNIGFDATLLKSRLHVNFDYYIKNTKDWLVEAPVLATAGAGAPYINGGNVKNKGVELNLTWNDVIGNDFSYSIGGNISYNKNEVGSIPTVDGIIHGSSNVLYANAPEFYRAENGHPIGYFWGFETLGIFQNQQQIDEWVAQGNGLYYSNTKPGDVIFRDVNHDGKLDDNDKLDLGNGVPDLTYGFNINLYWRNFDLGIVATGVAGNKIVQSYRNATDKQANYTTEILGRWTGEGTSNRIPRVTNGNENWIPFSDLYIHDGDFLRISNVTLGYDFAKVINQKWCSQCRLYFQAQNLLTFTKYNGMDPEIGYGTDGWVSGVDVGFYPRSRTLLFGVNLGF